LVRSILPEIHNILKPFQELEIICDETLTINNFKIESENVLIDEDLVGQVKKINNILNYSNLPEPELSNLFSFNNDEIIIDKVKSLKYLNGFDLIKEVDSSVISNILKYEHPQTVALILGKINRSKTCEILDLFPDELKQEIETRMSSTNKINKNMLDEIESVIYRLFNEELFESYEKNDGLNYINDIFVNTDKKDINVLYESIEEFNPELARKLRKEEKIL
jgi:flagellar motor switch protein FliG